jgi:hypothetical protein
MLSKQPLTRRGDSPDGEQDYDPESPTPSSRHGRRPVGYHSGDGRQDVDGQQGQARSLAMGLTILNALYSRMTQDDVKSWVCSSVIAGHDEGCNKLAGDENAPSTPARPVNDVTSLLCRTESLNREDT